MSKNVLVIGTYSAEGVDSFDWFQELPYLPDYDTIILDTTRIFNSWAYTGRVKQFEENGYLLSNVNDTDEKMSSNIVLVKRKLLEMLEFPVNVYALYAPDIVVWVERGPEYSLTGANPVRFRFIDTNDWCPISIDTIVEKGMQRGRKISVKDKSYEEYFKDFKGWDYYFVPDSLDIGELESHYRHRWKVTTGLEVIATNKVDKPLAIEFIPCFHRWAHDEDEEEGGWHSLPEKYGGSLTLLPTIDKYNTEALIEILLQRGKVFEETPPPTWVNDIEIPGEVPLEREIETQKEKLREAEASVKNKEASLREIRKYKRLLYDTGLSLQDVCKSTFEQLGAKTKPSEVSDEFIIEIEGKEALVEVKGNEKSIHKRDISQLITDRGQYLATTGEYVKGILVGNAWRRSHPHDRDIKGKPIFPTHVVEIAEDQNIGLVSTTELFKAHCKALEEPQHKTEILSKIISGKGIIKL